MTRREIRERQAYLRDQNKRHTSTLAVVPVDQWPDDQPPGVFRVWRSNRFLVQAYQEGPVVRLSVTRTFLLDDGTFVDGVTWDELQTIKRETGYEEREAVEVYPPDDDVVNVANMRHLWILPIGDRLPFSWKGL